MINMKSIKVIGSKDVEEYKESLLELFDYDREEVDKSFDKHYQVHAGVNISGIVEDAFKEYNEEFQFEMYELGNGDFILTIAWI